MPPGRRSSPRPMPETPRSSSSARRAGSSRRARRRSSARPSTTCSSTRAAACSSRLGRRHEAVLGGRDRVRGALRRDRRRAPRANGLGRRRSRRLRPRRAVRRARRRALHPRAQEGPASGPEAPRLRARPRRSGALRRGVRGDRLVAVHRARDRRGDRARPHAARPPPRRRGVRPRLALVRGGHRRSAGDRRRGDLRAPCVQRPRRIRDGLGALPRLPHRHGALGALRAPLPRRRGRRSRRFASRRGMRWSAARSSPRSRACGSLGARASISVRSPSRSSTCSCRALLVVLGVAFLLSPETLGEGLGFASGQDWSDLAFALPLAMLAYTGLETVANLAEEATEPGRTLPRSLFSAIGLVVVVTVLIGAIGLSAYPVSNGETALGERVAGGAARRHRGGVRRVAPRAPRGRARGRGRDLGRADPRRRRDDVVLGHHAPDLLARRARLAAARVRAPRAARASSRARRS